jgi:hypothetical protein
MISLIIVFDLLDLGVKKLAGSNAFDTAFQLYLWLSQRGNSSKGVEELREELAATMELNKKYLKQKFGTVSIAKLAQQLRDVSSTFSSLELLHQTFAIYRKRHFILIGTTKNIEKTIIIIPLKLIDTVVNNAGCHDISLVYFVFDPLESEKKGIEVAEFGAMIDGFYVGLVSKQKISK